MAEANDLDVEWDEDFDIDLDFATAKSLEGYKSPENSKSESPIEWIPDEDLGLITPKNESPVEWIPDEELGLVPSRSCSPSDWIDDGISDEELSQIIAKISGFPGVRVDKDMSSTLSDVQKAEEISRIGRITDPQLELLDPSPNIHNLFTIFDDRFFHGQLAQNAVCVNWAPRMTSSAGLCAYNSKSGLIEIRLSKPLLTLRPRSDLVETLVHEMIHAFLFAKKQPDNHGPIFHHHMNRINMEAGCKITVYHTFHNEVRSFQTHVWRCNGPCRDRRPYYGYVHRASNRPPSKADNWHYEHMIKCGGTFVKISEPPKTNKQSKASPKKNPTAGVTTFGIRKFFPPSPDKKPSSATSTATSSSTSSFIPFEGVGHVADDQPLPCISASSTFVKISKPPKKKQTKPSKSPKKNPTAGVTDNTFDIRKFFPPSPDKKPSSAKSTATVTKAPESSEPSSSSSFIPFEGVGHVLGGQPMPSMSASPTKEEVEIIHLD